MSPTVAQCTTPEAITEWHDGISSQINVNGYNPYLVFNMDETMLKSTTKKYKVFHMKDAPNISIQEDEERGMHITLALCISAAGEALTPLAILECQTLPDELRSLGVYYNWAYQPSGWMTKDIFENWIKDVFVPKVEATRLQYNWPNEPALLFVDGHSSRNNDPLYDYLLDRNIKLAKLPPHSSHILQPLDRGINGSFKQKFNKLKKSTFDSDLPERRFRALKDASLALSKALKRHKIIECFKVTGIYPWDVEVMKSSKHVIQELSPEHAERSKKRTRRIPMPNGGILTTSRMFNRAEDVNTIEQAPKRRRGRPNKNSENPTCIPVYVNPDDSFIDDEMCSSS